MEEVNFIISIGDSCVSAQLCKLHNAITYEIGYGFPLIEVKVI